MVLLLFLVNYSNLMMEQLIQFFGRVFSRYLKSYLTAESACAVINTKKGGNYRIDEHDLLLQKFAISKDKMDYLLCIECAMIRQKNTSDLVNRAVVFSVHVRPH